MYRAPLCSRAATGPDPKSSRRTSDEVDVLNTNDWQPLLCQILRGCNTRVVFWAVYRAKAPGHIPSTEFPHTPSPLDVVESVFAG
jgi:hypothetical protein